MPVPSIRQDPPTAARQSRTPGDAVVPMPAWNLAPMVTRRATCLALYGCAASADIGASGICKLPGHGPKRRPERSCLTTYSRVQGEQATALKTDWSRQAIDISRGHKQACQTDATASTTPTPALTQPKRPTTWHCARAEDGHMRKTAGSPARIPPRVNQCNEAADDEEQEDHQEEDVMPRLRGVAMTAESSRARSRK